jgi:SAM-dependent methyltransferase
MPVFFDIDAERKYYKHSPSQWKPAPVELVESLMSLTAGNHWVEFIENKKVLELGAGECTYLSYLINKGKPSHYTATDIFEDRFLPAKNHFGNKYTTLDFKVLRADHIEIQDSDFDTILAFGLYHHIPDLKSAFRQARSVLKKGGHLILRDPYAGNPVIKLKYSLIKRSENEWPLSVKKTQNALIESGFKLQRVNRFWIRFPNLCGGPWSTNIGFVVRAI